MSDEQARELATGEVFTARRGKEIGLVDELMDFDQSLQLAGQLAGIEPGKAKPRWLRPRRTFSEKLTGRPAGHAPAVGILGPDLPRLLTGGVFLSRLIGSAGQPLRLAAVAKQVSYQPASLGRRPIRA